VKVRDRDQKNIGKRRVPSAVHSEPLVDGFAPPKKKVAKQIDDSDE
jgi:ATP-dependent RNA helicase SrmB